MIHLDGNDVILIYLLGLFLLLVSLGIAANHSR